MEHEDDGIIIEIGTLGTITKDLVRELEIGGRNEII